MKVIFECETELGRCDADRVNGHFGNDPGEWLAFAHTSATMTGPKGMLRIEQRCYLRSAERLDEVRAQNWVKPSMTLEPVLGSEADTETVQELHESYAQKAQEEFMEASVVAVPSLSLMPN
jgi:hypothetical protein